MPGNMLPNFQPSRFRPLSSASPAAPTLYKREIASGDFAARVRDDHISIFASQFNSGFCLYTKLVIPDLSQGTAPVFGARVNGGLLLSVKNTGKLDLSNWSTLQPGTTVFSAGDVVSVFIRHSGGTTTMHSQIEGAGSPVEEFSAARTYTSSVSNNIFWGGVNDGTFKEASIGLEENLYDSAVWMTAAVSEADGLELLAETKAIGDVATPTMWLDPLTGTDKTETVPLMNNLGVVPSGEIFTGADIPGDNPDDFIPLRDPSDMTPQQYDLGSGLVYVAAYDNRSIAGGTKSFRLATSTDLTTWTDHSEIKAAAAGQAISDFLYMGGEAGSHDDFFLYYSEQDAGVAEIHLTTSNDMSTWTEDAANPVFANKTAFNDGVEDFRIVKVAANYWAAFFEHDGYQDDGARAVGAALHTGAVPTGNTWTLQNNDILGTVDVGYDDAGFFMANPCVCKDGSDIWLFYEGAAFGVSGQAPVTLVRKITPSANSDVFTASNWTKYGVANHRGSEKSFANCVTVEGGVKQIYAQQGAGATSGAGDGIGKIAFDPGIAVPVNFP